MVGSGSSGGGREEGFTGRTAIGYDHGMIENPKLTKIFRIVDLRNKNDHKVEFLGWGEG